jgi:hypothetical protein
MTFPRPLRRAAFLIVLLSASACGGADSVAPSSALSPTAAAANAQGWGKGGNDDHAHPKPVTCAPHSPVVGTGVFGPSGGTLVIGDSRLIIPGGALRDTVTITGTAAGDGTSRVNFQPEGLHFRKPAALVLSGAGCTLPSDKEASIVYLGTDGQVLETIEALYLPRWKLVAAPIVHFSAYAIAF